MAEDNDFDDIFGDGDFVPVDNNGNKIKNEPKAFTDTRIEGQKTEIEEPVKTAPRQLLAREDVPNLAMDEVPEKYLELVNRIKTQYCFLPKINYDQIYSELSELTIKPSPTPSLQVINDELQKVQAAKERLSEIYVDVLKSYNFKKRAVDILIDSWAKFTSEKSADKRKGEAVFMISYFSIDLSMMEGLFKACMHINENLNSLQDTLSRRITIMQLLMKLSDVGRGAIPGFDRFMGAENDGKSKNDLDNVM